MPTLNDPQCDFLDMPQKYRALVTGFGGGKTWVGCAGICVHALQWPGIAAGYFAPTYPLIRDVFYPTIEEVAATFDMEVDIRTSAKEVHLLRGGRRRITVKCRSMDNPSSIVGFKIGHAQVDELDTMPIDKARTAWRKIIARMRYNIPGLRNGIDVTTTPEGFKFVYEQWVKAVRDNPALAELYGLVQASTWDNELFLPEDYIPSLLASYPPQLIQAYLRGQFVNLTSGSVYPNFDRKLNHTNETIKENEALHIGMDFNVLNMTAVVNVVRDGWPRTLAEHVSVRDTPTMARKIKEIYIDKGHPVAVYPDASGANTSSKDASESDLSILRQHGIQIIVNPTNPAVKDRVNALDAMCLNALGERRWKINTDACPTTTEAMEQQAWGKTARGDMTGEPDKTGGFDHPNDALGYYMVKRFPIIGRGARAMPLTS